MAKDIIELSKRMQDMSVLQKKIYEAIKNHNIGEVVHAFEVMKIAILIKEK